MSEEVSKEALDALWDSFHGVQSLPCVPSGNSCKEALAAALPIERQRWEQEVRERLEELELRLADAYELLAQSIVKDEDGDPDADWMEDLEAPVGGAFFATMDSALTGYQGCLDDDEFAAQRTASLVKVRDKLNLPPPIFEEAELTETEATSDFWPPVDPNTARQEEVRVCPKCGSVACGHGMEPVTRRDFARIHGLPMGEP